MNDDSDWDFVYRPHRIVIWAWVAAIAALIIHGVFAYLLTKSQLTVLGHTHNFGDNGVRNVGLADQWALMLVGVVVAGGILLLTRSRVRVGERGVAVRNLIGERVFGWDQVVGISYPDRGSSAWLEFPLDEHVPVMAIRIGDGESAVAAMERVRELQERYGAAPR
ncbi:MAG: PH domain-containing protein [Gordonia sp. (in: high G+C Gram-positive bacteria)]|uniref:PH domain-containing protein n=1 Tax=Gordonia sp. (in: high G+C Gram-positive bacteria) TaxID=84139 RepID=UPI0039E50030